MGIYDRDYYQRERQPGMHLGGQWTIVGKLIALNVGVFVANMFLVPSLMSHMAASPNSLAEPWKIWQLLTYGFAHDQTNGNIAHIFWNMFGLFIFGRDIEAKYGSKEFLRIYLVTIVLGGLLFAIRGITTYERETWGLYQVVGASGAVTAITLLFCIHFPKRTLLLMMVLPVPAWSVGLLIIVVNVWGSLFGEGQNVAFDVHLVGAAFAIAYSKLGWNLGSLTPDVSRPRRWLKPKPKLKIHEPVITEDPYQSLDAEADQLLAKVKREGVGSLSNRERRLLEDYSRRMRQKHS